jgi:hypothetical protein
MGVHCAPPGNSLDAAEVPHSMLRVETRVSGLLREDTEARLNVKVTGMPKTRVHARHRPSAGRESIATPASTRGAELTFARLPPPGGIIFQEIGNCRGTSDETHFELFYLIFRCNIETIHLLET